MKSWPQTLHSKAAGALANEPVRRHKPHKVVKECPSYTARNYLRPHQVTAAASSAASCPTVQLFHTLLLCFQLLIVLPEEGCIRPPCRGSTFIVGAENISLSFGLLLALFKVKSVLARALLGCILTITDLYLSSLMESKLREDPRSKINCLKWKLIPAASRHTSKAAFFAALFWLTHRDI